MVKATGYTFRGINSSIFSKEFAPPESHKMLFPFLQTAENVDGVNSGSTSHKQRGHTEMGPRFKVLSERRKKWGTDLAIPGLVVWCVIHYTTAAPRENLEVSRLFSIIMRTV